MGVIQLLPVLHWPFIALVRIATTFHRLPMAAFFTMNVVPYRTGRAVPFRTGRVIVVQVTRLYHCVNEKISYHQ